jgi:hypothetical protein
MGSEDRVRNVSLSASYAERFGWSFVFRTPKPLRDGAIIVTERLFAYEEQIPRSHNEWCQDPAHVWVAYPTGMVRRYLGVEPLSAKSMSPEEVVPVVLSSTSVASIPGPNLPIALGGLSLLYICLEALASPDAKREQSN